MKTQRSHNIQLAIEDNLATLTFDREQARANLFDRTTLEELQLRLNQIRTVSVNALLIRSAKPKIFVAGADIKTLESAPPGELAHLIDLGHRVFTQLEELEIPTIAAIHGACLGGGYELALACDWRVASDDACTKVGLPETKLGILPAWGGTTRLPRLLGLPAALPLLLGGKVMGAKAAKHKGLIDDLVPAAHLEEYCREYLKKGKRPPEPHHWSHNKLSANLVERKAMQDLLKTTRGHYPALMRALKLACHSVCQSKEKSFREEETAIIELVSQPETHRLLELFFLNERARKLKIDNTDRRDLQHPAVIGAGVMGSGISYWLSTRGYDVLMQDVNNNALAKGMQRIERQYQHAVGRHLLSRTQARNGLDRILTAHSSVPLQHHDLIIEAASEDLMIKQQIFAELSNRCSLETVLATNTSALPIRHLAEVVANPARLVGIHFFNPVHRMKLVEVVRSELTSEQTLADAIAFVQRIGKIPVVVKDSPGFLVNRILLPYLVEAGKLFDQGIDLVQIDEAMLDFGMPMGPLRLIDEVGLDVAAHVAETLAAAFPDHMAVPEILQRMLNEGLLGRKAGKGFYQYDGTHAKPNPDAKALRSKTSASMSDIAGHLAYLMSDEAARCLDEGIVEHASDIDFAMVMGTGYAPFRGGPLHYSDDEQLIRPGFYLDGSDERLAS